MVSSCEASDTIDALKKLITIGIQAKARFDDGYTEVIFQNPDKRDAVFVDLYYNVRPNIY